MKKLKLFAAPRKNGRTLTVPMGAGKGYVWKDIGAVVEIAEDQQYYEVLSKWSHCLCEPGKEPKKKVRRRNPSAKTPEQEHQAALDKKTKVMAPGVLKAEPAIEAEAEQAPEA